MLVSDLNQLKISNVCSLSSSPNQPSSSPAVPAGTAATDGGDDQLSSNAGGVSISCAVCCASVPSVRLKSHIFIHHFPFYRPYRCRECIYQCGDVEIFVKEHAVISGHEGFDLVSEKIDYVELLVNMFVQQSEKLHRQDLSGVLMQLNAIKTVALENKNSLIARNNGIRLPDSSAANGHENSEMGGGGGSDESPPLSRFRLSTQMVRNATDHFVGANGNGAQAAAPASQRLPKRKNSWSSSSTTGTCSGASPSSTTPTPTPPAVLHHKTKRRRRRSRQTLVRKRNYLKCKLCGAWVFEEDKAVHANREHPDIENDNPDNADSVFGICFGDTESRLLTDDDSDEDLANGEEGGANEKTPVRNDHHQNQQFSTQFRTNNSAIVNEEQFLTPSGSSANVACTFSTPPTSIKIPFVSSGSRPIGNALSTPIVRPVVNVSSAETVKTAVQEIITTALDSLPDEKPSPLVVNCSGQNFQSLSSGAVPEMPLYRSSDSGQPSNRNNLGDESSNVSSSCENNGNVGENEPTTGNVLGKAACITCDFCQKTCETKETLKQHCLENHSGGFCGFFCAGSGCDFKSANPRRTADHCRSVHQNAKLLKRSVPTADQLALLRQIKASLSQKQIDCDISAYEPKV